MRDEVLPFIGINQNDMYIQANIAGMGYKKNEFQQ